MSNTKNISTAEDIQYYMNELQKDKDNPNVSRSDNYKEEKVKKFMPLSEIIINLNTYDAGMINEDEFIVRMRILVQNHNPTNVGINKQEVNQNEKN